MDTISLTRADFKKLLACLDIVSYANCTDCDIVKGLVRQKTNDRYGVIEIDLSSLLGQNDISFSMIKAKTGLLASFQLDNNVKVDDENITIEIDEKVYRIMDYFSKLNFTKPLRKFLDNTFIAEEEFQKMVQVSDVNLLFSGDIISYVKKRIKGICAGFAVDTIICTMEETTAKLSIATANNESSTDLNKTFSLNSQMKLSTFRISTMPFNFDIESDMSLKVYKVSDERLLCRFDMKLEGLPLIIYSQAQIESDKKVE